MMRRPFSRKGVSTHPFKGYAKSPIRWVFLGNMTSGFASASWKKGEFLKTLASCAEPGYPQNTSVNGMSASQITCNCSEWNPLWFMYCLWFFRGSLTRIWHLSIAPKTPGNPHFFSNRCSTSLAHWPEWNLINWPDRLLAIAPHTLR